MALIRADDGCSNVPIRWPPAVFSMRRSTWAAKIVCSVPSNSKNNTGSYRSNGVAVRAVPRNVSQLLPWGIGMIENRLSLGSGVISGERFKNPGHAPSTRCSKLSTSMLPSILPD